MSINTILKNDTLSREAEVNELVLKLDILGERSSTYEQLKKKYEKIRYDYYAEGPNVFKNRLENVSSMSRTSQYIVDIEQKILTPLKKLFNLSYCKCLAVRIEESDDINIEKISELLSCYMSIDDYFENEKKELQEHLTSLFYILIKKDASLNNRFRIIDILHDYREQGLDFIKEISILYLKEVKDIINKNRGNKEYTMLEEAFDGDFEKNDIIQLLKAHGIKCDVDNDMAKLSCDNRFCLDSSTSNSVNLWWNIKKQYLINPLPKRIGDNLILRKYDLVRVLYLNADLENVNLSETNAVIIPCLLKNKSLRNANLEGIDLRGVNFKDINISGANLSRTGADISGSKGICLEVSPYDNHKIFVSDTKITPYEFEQSTKATPFPRLFVIENTKFDNIFLCENRILRKYDMSCVDYHFADLLSNYKEAIAYKFLQKDCIGLDFSYTNIDFDPQEFTEGIILNLEGVDLRNKNFDGVEKYFAKCNLKGTGANISPLINNTVSPYFTTNKNDIRLIK